MKLNIITASANSVGKSILQRVVNPKDVTIAFSRSWTNVEGAFNIKVSDLTNTEEVKKSLLEVFNTLPSNEISEVNLFHNCCYAVCEIPNLQKDFPDHIDNPKLVIQDNDGDGIDDRSYHSLLTTFRNVLEGILSHYPEKNLSIWTICSLTDKKSYIPTIFQSLVKTNLMLRNDLEKLVIDNNNIQGVCISAATVRTETEDNFRKYCNEKDYRVSPESVAQALVNAMQTHKNEYEDIPLYMYNPRYHSYYKNETDEQMTERFKREIGLIE